MGREQPVRRPWGRRQRGHLSRPERPPVGGGERRLRSREAAGVKPTHAALPSGKLGRRRAARGPWGPRETP